MIKEKVKSRLGEKIKEWVPKNPKRIYFTIDKNDLRNVTEILYREFKMRLVTISGVDNEHNFELIYHFSFDKNGEIFNLRVFISDKNKPEVDSLTSLFQASFWIEREIHEMFGINFVGHPRLEHLLLDKDWPERNYPLRKSTILEKCPYPLKERD